MDHKNFEIIPAILPKSFEDLASHLSRVRGLARAVQIDVTDGKFVPSTTWPYNKTDVQEFAKIISQENGMPFWQDFDFELDLMLNEQIEEAKKWIEAGASRIIFHLEALRAEDTEEIAKLKSEKMIEIGFSIDTATHVEMLEPFLEMADVIQCMGIEKVGFQGQEFDPRVLQQISSVKELLQKNNLNLPIQVDGAVHLDTAQQLLEAGANRLIVGSALFESGDLEGTLEEFRNLI